jgi:23S rRNA (adenine2503-C2)-methyltransferase
LESNKLQKTHLKNYSLSELASVMLGLGEKKFRAQQIKQWIYHKRIDNFEQMNNIPKNLRDTLDEKFTIEKMAPLQVLESQYGDAVKFGFGCIESSHLVESVLLIEGDRRTACISSQLGCGLGCVFCETGKMGFIRNLTQEEIIGQLIGIDDYLALKSDNLVTNIVFMGMGEALSNYENFRSSLDIIKDQQIFNIGGRRITVSTAGVVPSIERLMAEKLNIGLAISLNAYSNEQRDQLMPVNRKYPIECLIKIAEQYYNVTGRRVTFEYVIIDGQTNTPEALNSLYKYLSGFPCKLNLIPVNPSRESQMKVPTDVNLEMFANELIRRGLVVTIRKSRGQDIWGACGQLAGRVVDRRDGKTTRQPDS